MKQMMRFIPFSRFIVAIVSLGVVGTSISLSHAQNSRKRSAPEQPYSDQYDMTRLLGNLETIRAKPATFNEAILIRNLKKGKLTFQPTAEHLDALRKAGASDELLKAIMEKAGIAEPLPIPETPLEPAVPKKGRLTVTCRPMDCEVYVDNQRIGTTTKGDLKDFVLPAGKVAVSARVKDHVADREGHLIEIEDNASASVEFSFKVDPNALIAKARAVHDGMIAALGGEAALKGAELFKASGSLDIRLKSGQSSKWPFMALVQYPSRARFEITKNNKKYVILKSDSSFALAEGRLQDLDLEELETGLRHLLDYYISKLVGLVNGPNIKTDVDKLTFAPDEDIYLRVEREAYKYRLRLGPDYRPKEIAFESAGLNTGLRILLTDLQKRGEVLIPQETQVILPGDGQRGVIIKFEVIEVRPTIAEEEWKSKGRRGLFGKDD